MLSKRLKFTAAVMGATAVALAGIGFIAGESSSPIQAASMSNAPMPRMSLAKRLSSEFEALHRAIKNSVVCINVIQEVPQSSDNLPMQLPKQFQQIIPPGAFPLTPPSHPNVEKIYGTGSGVILTSNGYIVTNNHVVHDATSVKVHLEDGRVYTAKIIGTDPKTDLAVIKINATGLQPATLGDSANVHPGDWVMAIGAPFGFRQTLTHGIVSAVGRTSVNIIAEHNPQLAGLTYEDFIQTDAPINPGNSGGPLVNMNGHVIGINSAIASTSGAFDGIGFSIPSDEVKYVTHQLIKYGKVVRGYLGISIADVRHSYVHKIALTFGYKPLHGVLIDQVEPGSPAAKGGLRRGEIIIGLDGQPVMRMNTLRDEIAMMRPGTKVTLKLFDDGKIKSVTFPLGKQPATLAMAAGYPSQTPAVPAESQKLGVTVSPVTPKTAKMYGLSAPHGVLVTGLQSDSILLGDGVEPGDIIVSVQGHRVNSPAQFNRILKKLDLAKGIRMSVRGRSGTERYIFVQKN
ncbi:MAG: Do family serine endopeptidase [Phycisphaerae bacterium]